MTAQTLIHRAPAALAGYDGSMVIDAAAQHMLRHRGSCVEIADRGQRGAEGPRRAP